jgi:TetR/AcrR family transcriptional repressor of mexJK operon
MNLKQLTPEKVRTCLGRPKDSQKREGIMSAAATLFMEQGYTLTSMDAVAKLADVSKLTIYSHFANKAELFKAVMQHSCDQQAAPESFLNYAKQPVETALLKLGRHVTELVFSADSLRVIRLMHAEAAQHPEVVQIFYDAAPQRVKAAFADLLTAWVVQGHLEVEDVKLATEQFFSLLKGEAHVKTLLKLEPQLTATAL